MSWLCIIIILRPVALHLPYLPSCRLDYVPVLRNPWQPEHQTSDTCQQQSYCDSQWPLRLFTFVRWVSWYCCWCYKDTLSLYPLPTTSVNVAAGASTSMLCHDLQQAGHPPSHCCVAAGSVTCCTVHCTHFTHAESTLTLLPWLIIIWPLWGRTEGSIPLKIEPITCA